MDAARILIDPPSAGPWNMAVDQALLENADESGEVTIRIYQWSEPTLSLGYFQKLERRNGHTDSLDCQVVRRSTGGGAIIHDHEITYSICIPSRHRWSTENERLYHLAHTAVIDVLGELQISAEICNARDPDRQREFLCFQRRADGDILIDNHKVGGSAQRRKKDALLQHGSLLIRRSNHATELPGIEELAGLRIDVRSFIENLATRLADQLGVTARRMHFDESEISTAKRIEADVYGNIAWTQRR